MNLSIFKPGDILKFYVLTQNIGTYIINSIDYDSNLLNLSVVVDLIDKSKYKFSINRALFSGNDDSILLSLDEIGEGTYYCIKFTKDRSIYLNYKYEETQFMALIKLNDKLLTYKELR
jgi:hypothetical protein